MIPGAMADRQQLIRDVFDALGIGELEPFQALFDPDAKWVGVPRRGAVDETPTCPDRTAIVDLLQRHHRNGRRFTLGELIEEGDRVAAEVAVEAPEWSAPV